MSLVPRVGRRNKNDSKAVAESAPRANRRSVCVIRTIVEQHFN